MAKDDFDDLFSDFNSGSDDFSSGDFNDSLSDGFDTGFNVNGISETKSEYQDSDFPEYEDPEDDEESSGGVLANMPIRIVIAGVAGIIVFLAIAFGVKALTSRSSSKEATAVTSNSENTGVVTSGSNPSTTSSGSSSNGNANNASSGSSSNGNANTASSGSSNSSTTSSVDTSDSGWTAIDGQADISFNEKPIECTFSVTKIEHLVKVENDSTLQVKTRLTGSISGFSGTYTLEVPYDTGTQLWVGAEFTVSVQIGVYNGYTVIGDISY